MGLVSRVGTQHREAPRVDSDVDLQAGGEDVVEGNLQKFALSLHTNEPTITVERLQSSDDRRLLSAGPMRDADQAPREPFVVADGVEGAVEPRRRDLEHVSLGTVVMRVEDGTRIARHRSAVIDCHAFRVIENQLQRGSLAPSMKERTSFGCGQCSEFVEQLSRDGQGWADAALGPAVRRVRVG